MTARKPSFLSAGAVLLLIIAGIGAAAGAWRLLAGLGPATNLSDDFSWGLWKYLNVMAGVALSAGGFTIAATVYILNLKQYKPLARPAVLTALAGYLSASISLLFDIGRPLTFWHPLATWQPHSMLFEIIWCLTLYTGVLALEFSPAVLEGTGRDKLAKLMRSKLVMIPLVMLAVTFSFLHQSSLGGLFLLMKGRLSDLWWTTMLPWNFFVSAVAVALAMSCFVITLSSRLVNQQADVKMLQGLARGTAVTLALYAALRIGDLLVKGKLGLAFAGDQASLHFLLEMALVLLPMALLFAFAQGGAGGILFAQLMVIAGVVLNRFDVVYFSQKQAGVFYTPSWAEIGMTAGVFAAALLVCRAAILYLPVVHVPAAD